MLQPAHENRQTVDTNREWKQHMRSIIAGVSLKK